MMNGKDKLSEARHLTGLVSWYFSSKLQICLTTGLLDSLTEVIDKVTERRGMEVIVSILNEVFIVTPNI